MSRRRLCAAVPLPALYVGRAQRLLGIAGAWGPYERQEAIVVLGHLRALAPFASLRLQRQLRASHADLLARWEQECTANPTQHEQEVPAA